MIAKRFVTDGEVLKKQKTRATVYSPFANNFAQCQYAPSDIMPNCEVDMFPTMWKDVSYVGRTKLDNGRGILVGFFSNLR